MNEDRISNAARIATIGFVTLLAGLFVAAVCYLLTAKDFVKPISFAVDRASYEYSMDEFADFLRETGYMTETEYSARETERDGIEEARNYGGTIVMKWDVSVADKESPFYEEWSRISSVGNFTLKDGTLMVNYGIFAVSYKEMDETDTKEKYNVLNSFPTAYTGCHSRYTVWDYSMDNLLDYFIQCGFFTEDDILNMAPVATDNKIADHIDMMWFDVPNLVDGNEDAEYWRQMQEDGYMYLYGHTIYVPVMNGPFAVWVNANSSCKAEDVYEAYARFPMDYDGEPGNIQPR